MSKRSKAARSAKTKRQRAAARRMRWTRHWPWIAVGGVAAGLVAVFFLVSVGGTNTTEVEASYPEGYTPPALGSDSASVEMVMWGDFQCPFCRRFELSTLPELVSRYVDSGEVRFLWRNFENYGLESHDSAVAAYCAGEQGKFWEYHNVLYEQQRGVNTGAFSRPNLQRFAQELGLETTAFDACLDGVEYDSVISADKKLGRSQGVSGTPTFFINGEIVVGAQPTETFIQLIESAKVQAQQAEG